MAKRKTLAEIGNSKRLAEAIESDATTEQADNLAPVKAESNSEAVAQKNSTPPTTVKSKKPPSRMNTKAITGHFDPSVSKQLKMLAVTQDSSIQELLREAINDLFTKHGQNPIA